jgi:hypothetical protein
MHPTLLLLLLSAPPREIVIEDRPLSGWTEWLRSGEVRRNQAMRIFQQLGVEAAPAVPQIVKLLRAEDLPTRTTALHVLGFIGPGAKDAVGPLLDTFRQRDPLLPLVGVTLAKLGPPAEEALLQALHDRE